MICIACAVALGAIALMFMYRWLVLVIHFGILSQRCRSVEMEFSRVNQAAFRYWRNGETGKEYYAKKGPLRIVFIFDQEAIDEDNERG